MYIKKIFRYLFYKILNIREYFIRKKIVNTVTVKDKFTLIYKSKYWSDPFSKRSVSGYGSDYKATKNIIPELNLFIKENKINSILDIPCGDFNWIKKIDLNQISYIGADIVEQLVKDNNLKYSSDNLTFKQLDIIEDKLPKVDLVIVRDCFIHLSNKNIDLAVTNILNSKSRFMATTNFLDDSIKNKNISTGDFRFINLLKAPFNFIDPIKDLNDSFDHREKIYSKKRLSVWDLKDLKNN